LPTSYRYFGSAYGVAGLLTTPLKEVIDTQAPAVLADFGGHSINHSENFKHRDILHFSRAHTEVVGTQSHLDRKRRDENDDTFSTLVKSSIEHFNLMGMVTADRIVANMVATFNKYDHPEQKFKLIGSRFENLRVAGIPVKVCLNLDVLDKCDTHETLGRNYRDDKRVRDLFGDDELRNRYPNAPAEVKRFLSAPPESEEIMPQENGAVTLSIVRKLEPECNALECYGHVIYIEGFGTIRLGEVRGWHVGEMPVASLT
jgi:hypothetical protein